MGGLYLRDLDTPLTTGNNYTVVSAVNAVLKASKKLNFSSKNSTAAIVGATGSIGKGISQLLSKDVSRLLLIGNPKNKKSSINRLYRVAGEIYSYLSKLKNSNYKFNKNSIGSKLSEYNLPDYRADIHRFIEFAQNLENKDTPILITTDINEVLPLANIIVSATSTTDILIRPDNLRQGAVVCDISRPGNVSKELLKLRPDILVIDGGVVEVPGRPSLGWNFGFDKGLAYACMAETMMLALEHRYENMSIGSSGVNLDNILYMKKLAEKHGFKLANFRSFNRPLDPKTWQKLLDARNKIEESAI